MISPKSRESIQRRLDSSSLKHGKGEHILNEFPVKTEFKSDFFWRLCYIIVHLPLQIW